MSLKDTSIEERSIISSLAATKSFSAVAFLAAGGRGGMLVFNSDPMTCLAGEIRAQITRCGTRTQELIDRLTKSFAPLKPAPLIPNPNHKPIRESSHGRGLYRRRRTHRRRPQGRTPRRLASGGSRRFRAGFAAGTYRRRSRTDRRRDHGLRDAGRRTVQQHRAQRHYGVKAAGKRARHLGRPAMRLIAAGAALRRASGDV